MPQAEPEWGAGEARIAAVILNYRTPDLVVRCVESLVGEMDPHREPIVIVDNASGDGSAERIREAIASRGWPGVRLVEAKRNGGFSAGHNLGVRSVPARAYLLLNSDLLVRPGALEALRSRLDRDPRLGVVGPRLEWPDGTPQMSCFRDRTPLSELIASAGTGPIRRLFARFDVPMPVPTGFVEAQWISFAAVMIRSDVFQQVGELDEGFFMYFEDAEFCRRVRRSGWRVGCEPAARMVHLRGGSSPVKALSAARKRRPGYYYASRRRYFIKLYGTAGWLAANVLWTVGRAISWLREILARRPRHTVERELFDIWTR